jgi:hypothetical protein
MYITLFHFQKDKSHIFHPNSTFTLCSAAAMYKVKGQLNLKLHDWLILDFPPMR